MKRIVFALIISIIIVSMSSCGNSNQSKAIEEANKIQSVIKENRPGTVATSANGYMMKAKLDGKDWEASSMMPPDAAGRIVGYYKDQYIGLPYSKADMVTGKKIIIGENEAVDLSLNTGCLWKDIKGEIEITKLSVEWVEGKFFFTTMCSSTNKALEVIDGFFRIPVEKNQ